MCRDRERSIATFHTALKELHGSVLLPHCHVRLAAPANLASTELMSVATDAAAAVAAVEEHMQAHANGHNWEGKHMHTHTHTTTLCLYVCVVAPNRLLFILSRWGYPMVKVCLQVSTRDCGSWWVS